ncbi:MAG: fibronectin type III domain-containing protein [Planctomycetes bacterium]|nr:fibronectin type III domain-containing protein [Planctomycetota bacterium]
MRAFVLLGLLWLGSCSGSGGTAIPYDDALRVASVTFPSSPSGLVALGLVLVDDADRAVDLVLEVSYDGVHWRNATLADGEVTTGLAASAAGTAHTLTWDSVADLGFRMAPLPRMRASLRLGAAIGAPTIVDVPPLDNLAAKAARVEHHMIHYGPIDAATALIAKRYDLVVVHPFAGAVSSETVRDIQRGFDPNDPADDVIVLAYLSIGEDLRTVGLTDAEMLLDPRFVGDASGPRIDPRGPDADGQSLQGLPLLGSPTNSPGGTQYASWYLDDNSVDNSPSDVGDGLPDRNAGFGGCFVNAGDPQWFEVLDAMTLDGVDGQPGMQELLTANVGRGFDCDGLFYDTFDTCAPNFYTDGSSFNQSEFEWTAPGFAAFTAHFKQRYPDKLALQNRGMFFFDPRLPHYAVTTRANVDLVLVESYRLDSSTSQQYDAFFFPDNKHNFAPKLLAEAGRPDGFRVLSLGYAEGPGIEHATLLGSSNVGFATLIEDVLQAQVLAGFAHYMTDAGLTLANTFAVDNLQPDTEAPRWSSTYNDNANSWPTPPDAPTPRPGIRRVVASDSTITIHWDIAQDQSRVGYALYLQTTPFDFVNDPTLAAAERRVLVPEVGDGYVESGVGPSTYPYRATIAGLQNGTTYHLCVRAFDELGHEEQNEIALSATPGIVTITLDGEFSDWALVPVAHTDPDDVPDSAGPDWLEIKLHHDATNFYVRFTSANSFNLDGSPYYGYSRTLVFLDLDENAATGWPVGSIGSDLLLAGDGLFTQSSVSFNTGSLGTITALPATNVTECELAIPWAQIDAVNPGASHLRLLFVNDEVSDFAPEAGYVQYDAVR